MSLSTSVLQEVAEFSNSL